MKVSQTTSAIMMVRPANFGFNVETAVSNPFQRSTLKGADIQKRALEEFDQFRELLTSKGLELTIIEDLPEQNTPDSIFPNNWLSTHHDGSLYLYPMEAPNRRKERRMDVIDVLKEKFLVRDVVDLSPFEQENMFLEGTGSMVLDYVHNIAYACLSTRTHKEVLNHFSALSGFEVLHFEALDTFGRSIYHTNIMMCLGDRFALVCLSAVKASHRKILLTSLQNTGKEVLEITYDQMLQFTGNAIELKSIQGQSLLIMSESGYRALTNTQLDHLGKYCDLVFSPLGTIETCGGGSARCMIAGIFLPAL